MPTNEPYGCRPSATIPVKIVDLGVAGTVGVAVSIGGTFVGVLFGAGGGSGVEAGGCVGIGDGASAGT